MSRSDNPTPEIEYEPRPLSSPLKPIIRAIAITCLALAFFTIPADFNLASTYWVDFVHPGQGLSLSTETPLRPVLSTAIAICKVGLDVLLVIASLLCFARRRGARQLILFYAYAAVIIFLSDTFCDFVSSGELGLAYLMRFVGQSLIWPIFVAIAFHTRVVRDHFEKT